ncbi:cobyric acid synthase CobQ [Desulfofarcimen acetoxidans DSM 771]|jgi:adenosylcobyric acid synthase|uniref:Cobyric acid synthase n=1 Tax=Desulfofarcimen acetoxidans (strain ATCC 49208 / DSM 771 / KCTC 5769 / VKM B-1644 / 5575) TaxID=485916 RepID=C8W3Q9_DESAS|nr:cobyric acid synthase [Desulfofarcimen acetoxidans]ACV63845.1 cobyric acid synthase CobQ [Desulfofarcimen acetoxidans DSM 771]
MSAKTIMVQGTASHVGKSILVAALCRIFYRDGYKVAPFKSQNMALNSFVTADGGEMGRAQVVQAEASGLPPDVDMNPILLKPTGQASSQVIVLGRPLGNMSAAKYHSGYTLSALDIIEGALDRLRSKYDIIVIEGAGSPAEVNLQDTEIVNMRIASMAGAPVLLAADIDKGGALASVVGTLELIKPEDRDRVAGIIINKFRGDVALFQPAVDFLEQKIDKPVLGVVPYFHDLRIQEEDSVSMERSAGRWEKEAEIDIAVVHLPHISNFTDFDPLENEPDVNLRYVRQPEKLGHPDMIIIPGSKNTIEDLLWLQNSGLAGRIISRAGAGTPVVGICGGFQMLGKELHDPLHTESNISSMPGLGLLNTATTFEPEKTTTQVEAAACGTGIFLAEAGSWRVEGYEIHMGQTELLEGAMPAFNIRMRSGEKVDFADGAVNSSGLVLGTYIHGVFDQEDFRRHCVNKLRLRKGLPPYAGPKGLSVWEQRQQDYDRLAEVVRTSLDMKKIYAMLGLDGPLK